jgi:polyhydroxybutyrate depolymerase
MRSAGMLQRFVRAVLAVTGSVVIAGLPAPAASAQEGPAAPTGCGQATQGAGTSTRHEISIGGRPREFLLHLPAGYDGSQALPVVLAFHGHGRDGAHLEEISKLSQLSAIVVYPNGVINENDDNRRSWQGAPYAAPGVDDVAFTADLLDHLQDTVCVDPARVYATGISNGGGFVGLLGCRMADRLAAVAPVAGAFYPATSKNCRPARPVPVLEFHGTADAAVPYHGDTRDLPAIPDWVAGWVDRNGCTERSPDERIEPDIAVSSWVGCRENAEVRHVAVEGGGHTWPGADSPSGDGATTQTIEAHEMIWDFVGRHQLPPVP